MPDHRAHASTSVPPKYKVALVTWAGVYPVITAILAPVGPRKVALPGLGTPLLGTAG